LEQAVVGQDNQHKARRRRSLLIDERVASKAGGL
jgi:hypothetical protein